MFPGELDQDRTIRKRQRSLPIGLHSNIVAKDAAQFVQASSWATAIIFQSRYRSGMVTPKIGEAGRTVSPRTSEGPNCAIISSATMTSTPMMMILRIVSLRP
jgi:hypothetical protein